MIVIENISQIATPEGRSGPLFGREMGKLRIYSGKNIWIENGKIARITSERPDGRYERIDAENGTVLPAFVDPHTHTVFSGYRDFELQLKLDGKSYSQILSSGGGIYHTVKMVRKSSRKEIFEESFKRIENMAKHGTLSAEIKTGYGLDYENERKILDVIEDISEKKIMDIKKTFLFHVIPQDVEYETFLSSMFRLLMERKQKIDFVDVFCDEGAFSVDQTRNIFSRAMEMGFGLKIHADEIKYIGCSLLAREFPLHSIDHLLNLPYENYRYLKNSIPVLLPGTSMTLMENRYADARKMIDSGLAVSLATDLNPNCYTENMQEIISLAIYNMKMKVEEAITASTHNAALAAGFSKKGSLEEGYDADIIILDVPSYTHLGYHFGINLVRKIIKNGKEVKI